MALISYIDEYDVLHDASAYVKWQYSTVWEVFLAKEMKWHAIVPDIIETSAVHTVV